jgi:hypothetical protein
LKDWLQPQRAAGMATAVRRFETPPGKHYGKPRVMLRSGEDASVMAESRRRDLVFGYIIPHRDSSHSIRLDERRGFGGCVAGGPFADSSAWRFISRSAWT